jgi:GTP-binding protein
LIEGAHEGVGLGTRFLKHLERTRLIAHLVDTSDANDRDPVRDYEIIMHELASFSPELAAKPMILVATKLDATTNHDHLEELRAFAAARGLEFHAISSATGEGIVELVRAMADALDRLPKPAAPAETQESRDGANFTTHVSSQDSSDAEPEAESEAAHTAPPREES